MMTLVLGVKGDKWDLPLRAYQLDNRMVYQLL